MTSTELVELARQLSAPKPVIHVMQGWRGKTMTHWTNPETGQDRFAISPEAWYQLVESATKKYDSLALNGAEVRWEHPNLPYLTLAIAPKVWPYYISEEEIPTQLELKTVTLWPDGKVTT